MNKPIIFYEGHYSQTDLENFKKKHPIWKIIDVYKDQQEEYFYITHLVLKSKKRLSDLKDKGNWVYFPWSGILLHMLSENEYNELRTNRNKYLINGDEQRKLYNTCVAFAGLSIGSHFAISLAYSTIAKNLKLADFDQLETSNLNRFSSSLASVGRPKIEIITRQIYEINPYAQLHLFSNGLTKENLNIFVSNPKPDLIFEAIDDLEMKVRLRLSARAKGIPVIMFTNLGDNLLVDIERFDRDKKLPLFNGLLGETPEKILTSKISEKEKTRFIIDIVNIENIPTRALESLLQINKTLVGRPQLYSTVTVGGGFAAYLTKRLLLGKSLPSGRRMIRFNEVFLFQDDTDDAKREETITELKKRFKL